MQTSADISAMTMLPDPPVFFYCLRLSCIAAQPTRALRACDCNVEADFRSIYGLDLKTERLRWHPDRFAKCPEEYKEEFMRKGNEVLEVLNRMYEQSRWAWGKSDRCEYRIQDHAERQVPCTRSMGGIFVY